MIFSCTKNEEKIIIDIKYSKSDSIINIIYTNNSDHNSFFINPNFSICQLELNNKNQYIRSSVSPCIIEYSLDKKYNSDSHNFDSIIKNHYLKFFDKNQTKENLKNLYKDNEIIVVKKNEAFTQRIKINSFYSTGMYEVDFINIEEFLENLKTHNDSLYSYFKGFDSLSYKDYKYHNKDFIINNNKFSL